MAVLIPIQAYLQFGITKDCVLLAQTFFYASPLWLGLVGLTRLIIRWATVF